MTFEQVHEIVRTASLLHPWLARLLYDFVRRSRPASVLELGFAHGASTCYIAAALEANQAGHVTTIDNQDALNRRPGIAELLADTGLAPRVTAVFADRSYTWELMKMLQRQEETGNFAPPFDFCFLDGAHLWDPDGLAFLIVLERLLAPGGWFLFDDVEWTVERSPSLHSTPWVQAMTQEEREAAQVGLVVRLLAARHPLVQSVRVCGGWAWVRKRPEADTAAALDDPVAELYRIRRERAFLLFGALRARPPRSV